MAELAFSAALEELGRRPIWAARGAPETLTDKDGKPLPKRAPIDPKTGRAAANNKPSTWGPRPAAEARAAKFPKDREPGVGLMLGPRGAPKGYVLAGTDLDGARDPETGEIAAWAETVVERLDTYTESSPSGTGLHQLFYVAEEDIEALREAGLVRNFGTTFAQAVIAGLEDVATVGQPVEQGRGHLGVAEDRRPFAEAEVGGDGDAGALVELAQEVEEQGAAGGREREIAEFVEE